MAEVPLFGLVATGQPVVFTPTEKPTPTSWLYTIPDRGGVRPGHLAVFLTPGASLPPDTAAAIYLVGPPAPGAAVPTSTFIGAIGPGKESAVYRLGGPLEVPGGGRNVVVGVGLEGAADVAARIEELDARTKQSPDGRALQAAGGGTSISAQGSQQPQVNTVALAQRIIRNAFNFLASFSGTAGTVEVVPLKAFEDWWRKFESRIRSDPGFLERED